MGEENSLQEHWICVAEKRSCVFERFSRKNAWKQLSTNALKNSQKSHFIWRLSWVEMNDLIVERRIMENHAAKRWCCSQKRIVITRWWSSARGEQLKVRYKTELIELQTKCKLCKCQREIMPNIAVDIHPSMLCCHRDDRWYRLGEFFSTFFSSWNCYANGTATGGSLSTHSHTHSSEWVK